MVNNILHVAGAIIELSNILLCYSQVLQAEISKKRQNICLAYIGIILCNVINILCNYEIQPAIINMLCCLFVPLLVMDSKKNKWIILYPCAFMIFSIISVAISFIMAIILNISQAQVANNILLSLIANLIFTVLMITIYLIKKMRGTQEKITLIFSNSIYIVITIGALTLYLLIGLVQYIGSLYEIPNIQINLLGFFLSVVGIVFFLIFLGLLVSIYKNEIFQNEMNMYSFYLSEQEKYIQLILEKDNEMRKFRHDAREHIYIISQCIEEKDYETAKRYIDNMNESFGKAQVIRYTGITAVNVIISEKKNCMDIKGIKFVYDINLMKLPEHVAVYDVCTLLINILNNAIRACEYLQSTDKVIKLVVDVDEDKIYIYSQNKFNNKIEFDNNQNPITSKKDGINHGLGSKIVRSVVKKYDGDIKYSIDNQEFIVEIIV